MVVWERHASAPRPISCPNQPDPSSLEGLGLTLSRRLPPRGPHLPPARRLVAPRLPSGRPCAGIVAVETHTPSCASARRCHCCHCCHCRGRWRRWRSARRRLGDDASAAPTGLPTAPTSASGGLAVAAATSPRRSTPLPPPDVTRPHIPRVTHTFTHTRPHIPRVATRHDVTRPHIPRVTGSPASRLPGPPAPRRWYQVSAAVDGSTLPPDIAGPLVPRVPRRLTAPPHPASSPRQ